MPEVVKRKPSVGAAVQVLKARLATNYPEVPAFASVFISSKRPSTDTGQSLPDHFIRVTRTNGGMLNRVTDRATLLVECFSATGQGEQLALAAIATLEAAAGQRQRYAGAFLRALDNVFGPTDFPDPLTPSHDRYQFTCDLLVSTN